MSTAIPTTTALSAEADQAFCVEMLPKVSRTFTLSIERLPESLSDAVRVAYLLCRIVDSIEDEAHMKPADRRELYNMFDEIVGTDTVAPDNFEAACKGLGLGEGSDDAPLCAGSGAVFRTFRRLSEAQRNAVRPHVLEMSAGMRAFTSRADYEGKLRLEDMEALERYCYYVAGTVGHLLTALFEQTVPDLDDEIRTYVRARAVSFGLGLQMVNIVKDVTTDFLRGDCFLPLRLATEAGISMDDLLEPANRDAGLQIIRAVSARARTHLKRAREYTQAWPTQGAEHVRLFCIVPLALALATLREVETGDDTLRPGRTPKISRPAALALVAASPAAAKHEDALRALLDAQT